MSQEILTDVKVIKDFDCFKIVLVTNKRQFARIIKKGARLFDVWCELLALANKFGKVLPDPRSPTLREAETPIPAATFCKECGCAEPFHYSRCSHYADSPLP